MNVEVVGQPAGTGFALTVVGAGIGCGGGVRVGGALEVCGGRGGTLTLNVPGSGEASIGFGCTG
jgi:hypothetical protein